MQRQILWEKSSQANPENHTYRILIYNEPREVNRITQKLDEYLQPILEQRTLAEGRVGDLNYKFIEIETPTNTEEFDRVYKGKIRRDRRLEKRRTQKGESDLVHMISLGKI